MTMASVFKSEEQIRTVAAFDAMISIADAKTATLNQRQAFVLSRQTLGVPNYSRGRGLNTPAA